MRIGIVPEEGGYIEYHVIALSENQLIQQLENDDNRIKIVCSKGRSPYRTVITTISGESLIGHSFVFEDNRHFDSTLDCFLDDDVAIMEFNERDD